MKKHDSLEGRKLQLGLLRSIPKPCHCEKQTCFPNPKLLTMEWKNEGKLMPPSAPPPTAAQGTSQLHKGIIPNASAAQTQRYFTSGVLVETGSEQMEVFPRGFTGQFKAAEPVAPKL